VIGTLTATRQTVAVTVGERSPGAAALRDRAGYERTGTELFVWVAARRLLRSVRFTPVSAEAASAARIEGASRCVMSGMER